MTDDYMDSDALFDDSDYAEDSLVGDEPEPLVFQDDEPILTHLLRKNLVNHELVTLVSVGEFAEIVVPHLIHLLKLDSAKGGTFAEEKANTGADTTRYGRDQSLRAHLLNGLLASLHLYQLACEAGNHNALALGDAGERLLIATYILHDYTKLPSVKPAFEGLSANPTPATITTIREVVADLVGQLHLNEFFEAGGQNLHLDDLIWGIYNTQVTWGTLPQHLVQLQMNERILDTVVRFSRLADLLAYGTFLEDANLKRLNEILTEALSKRPFDLTSHRLTQVTGVLSGFIHNGVIEAMRGLGHVPLLFAPNGVIYASPREATYPSNQLIAERVTAQVLGATLAGIQNHALGASPVGFGWGLQGIKDAPFFQQLLTPTQRLYMVWVHLRRKLLSPKSPDSTKLKTYKRLQKGIEKGWFIPEFIEENRDTIDQRTEAIGDWLAYAYTMDDEVGNSLLDIWGMAIDEYRDLMATANSGGVKYWTAVIATDFIARHRQRDPSQINNYIVDIVLPELTERLGGEEIRDTALLNNIQVYIETNIVFPEQSLSITSKNQFQRQLNIYANSKTNRSDGIYDTVYNLPDGVEHQQETVLPYMPTPYSQRLPLGAGDALGSGWRRGISAVGVMNMILMQLTLKQPFKFEDRKGKMLFIYPVYYFTPETGDVTLDVLQRLVAFHLVDWLKHTESGLNITAERINQYHPLLKKPEKWSPPIQTMQFPVNIAPTFAQVALDGGNKPTDVEGWMNAVFIALILAAVLDVKIVASESPVPLYQTGTEFNETVRFDALHAGFADLIGREVVIDQIIPMLQRVTILASVIVDGFGYKDWGQIATWGRELATDPANVFAIYRRLLEKGERGVSSAIARRYIRYVEILQETSPYPERSNTLNYAREMVSLYRQFYRGKGYASNAVLRPVQEAADVIIKADTAHSDPAMLVDAIWGKLIQIETGMLGKDIQGYLPRGSDPKIRREVMHQFAEFFVYEYFLKALKGRKASLRGTQFNLLRMACDAVYRDIDAQERTEQNAPIEETDN